MPCPSVSGHHFAESRRLHRTVHSAASGLAIDNECLCVAAWAPDGRRGPRIGQRRPHVRWSVSPRSEYCLLRVHLWRAHCIISTGFLCNCFVILKINTRPCSVFAIFPSVCVCGGGGIRPLVDCPLIWLDLRGKMVYSAWRGLVIACKIVCPRSTFDLFRSGQRSYFGRKWHFSYLIAHSSKTMRRHETFTGMFLAFNSEPDRVLIRKPVPIFMIGPM